MRFPKMFGKAPMPLDSQLYEQVLRVAVFHLIIASNSTRICRLCLSESAVCEKKKMGHIILVALTAHHTPNFSET